MPHPVVLSIETLRINYKLFFKSICPDSDAINEIAKKSGLVWSERIINNSSKEAQSCNMSTVCLHVAFEHESQINLKQKMTKYVETA